MTTTFKQSGEMARSQDPEDPNISYVIRRKNGSIEQLKEVVSSSGENFNPDYTESTETITITRTIGQRTQF